MKRGDSMNEVRGETINFYNAGQVVQQLKSISSTRALSRWAKVVEDSTSYTFKRKSNNSRIYTDEDVQKFIAVDSAYSKEPASSIDSILIAHFSLVADKQEQENSSMPLDTQVLKTLAYQNEQLFNQNKALAESLDNVQKELSSLRELIQSNNKLIESNANKRKGFFGRFRK